MVLMASGISDPGRSATAAVRVIQGRLPRLSSLILECGVAPIEFVRDFG